MKNESKIRELTLSEINMVAGGGLDDTEQCTAGIWSGAVGGMINGALTGSPVGFAVSSFSGIILGAVTGGCFRNDSKDSNAGGGGGGGGGGLAHERLTRLPQQYSCGPDTLE